MKGAQKGFCNLNTLEIIFYGSNSNRLPKTQGQLIQLLQQNVLIRIYHAKITPVIIKVPVRFFIYDFF